MAHSCIMGDAMNIVLFGPPGAGKGTQATKIADGFGLLHISTGDILRAAVKDGAELGALAKTYMDKGELVPDEVIIGIIKDRIAQPDAKGGFMLDGFPRTIPQARALDAMLDESGSGIDMVVSINVDDAEILARVRERQRIEKREDDSEEVVRNRLEVYMRQTAPLKDYYENAGILNEIDGLGKIDEVFERIDAALSSV